MSSSGRYEVFLVDRGDDGVATVTMNRPEKLNAMHPTFFRELIAVMADMSEDDAVGAVVLRGAGRAFSAGGDIATFPALCEDVDRARRHVRLVFDAFHAVERASVPVIAAIHGVAHGGGTELTCACDYAVASEDATFAFRESEHGLMPGFGVTKGPRKMGAAWTLRLATTAEIIDAATAWSIGLVQEVVEGGEPWVRAHELAAAMAAKPQSAVHSVKHHLNRATDDGLQAAVEATALLFATPAAQANVQRFLRRPR